MGNRLNSKNSKQFIEAYFELQVVICSGVWASKSTSSHHVLGQIRI